MNKTLKAADEVKKLHRMFSALGEVVDVLDRIGSVEQAEQEALARVEKLNGEAANLVTQINAASVEAQAIIDSAKAKSDEVISDAVNAAHELQTQAQVAMQEAKSDAEQIVNAAQLLVQSVEADALAANERLASAEAEIVELEKRADKARDYISKLSAG